MSDIDSVIKRSRARGGFKKKGYFTLAYQKAKTKVSEYALPSPWFYCLEFVQAAVALEARFIDVATTKSSCTISFIGKHFTGDDLKRLFDFLLTSTDNAHFRARRRLAVGTAAALSLPDASITIESGDGTLAGSVRLELKNINDQAVIGTPKKPISGTFIKASYRPTYLSFPQTEDEALLIEERCLDLPTSLSLNGDLITGYRFTKEIRLPQFKYNVVLDEGELYGGLGFDRKRTAGPCQIKILTNGVWISALGIDRLPFGIAGVIDYDRLHKSASQYGIVQDERVDELTERLKPYADEICRKRGDSEEERLAFLFNRPMPEITGAGESRTAALQDSRGFKFGTLTVWHDPARDCGLVLNVISDNEEQFFDCVGFPSRIPLLGKLCIPRVSMDMVRFRNPDQEGYQPLATVGLNEEFYKDVQSALKNCQPSFEQSFTLSLNHQLAPPPAAEDELEPNTTDQMDAPQDRPLAPDVESLSEDMFVENEEDLSGSEELSLPSSTDDEDVVSYNELFGEQEVLYEKVAYPPGERFNPPMLTHPGMDRSMLMDAQAIAEHFQNSTDSIEATAASLLQQILRNMPLHVSDHEDYSRRIGITFQKLDDKTGRPCVFAPVENETDEPAPFMFNSAHPLVARSLGNLHREPLGIYLLASMFFDTVHWPLSENEAEAAEARFVRAVIDLSAQNCPPHSANTDRAPD